MIQLLFRMCIILPIETFITGILLIEVSTFVGNCLLITQGDDFHYHDYKMDTMLIYGLSKWTIHALFSYDYSSPQNKYFYDLHILNFPLMVNDKCTLFT